MVKLTRRQVYEKYKDMVNMSYSELFFWSKTQASMLASVNRAPIMRNLRLLRKPFYKWTTRDETEAKKTISFIARMKKVPKGDKVYRNYSKRDLALKNWAYDINKK